MKLKNKSKEEFEDEVSSGRFPPYIHYKIVYTSPEERRPQPALMKVDMKGTNEDLKLSCEIMEEVCKFNIWYFATYVCTGSPRTMVSNGLTNTQLFTLHFTHHSQYF